MHREKYGFAQRLEFGAKTHQFPLSDFEKLYFTEKKSTSIGCEIKNSVLHLLLEILALLIPCSHAKQMYERDVIAILVCDSQSEILKQYGDFGDQGIDLLTKSGLKTPTKKYSVYNGELPSDDELGSFKGIYITGSRSDAFSKEKWISRLKEWIRKVYFNLDIPIVGVCFGHQVISLALGCKVERSLLGFEAGIRDIKLNPQLPQGLIVSKSSGTLSMVQMHQDIVCGLPPAPVQVIGSSDMCSIQGLYQDGKLLTFQGHPEFVTDVSDKLVKSLFQKGLISESSFEDMQKSLSQVNEGSAVGESLVRFFNGVH